MEYKEAYELACEEGVCIGGSVFYACDWSNGKRVFEIFDRKAFKGEFFSHREFQVHLRWACEG